MQKRSTRPKTIAGLGEGLRARKSIDLAIKHPKNRFFAVDLMQSKEHFGYLREKQGHTRIPGNLTIRNGESAQKFLQTQAKDSLDHVYAHFLLQHVKYSERQEIFRELMRTMRPGAKFVTIEDGHYSKQLPIELRKNGFRVTQKRISAKELAKLRTDNADMNSKAKLGKENLLRLVGTMPPEQIAQMARNPNIRSAQALKETDIKEVREIIRKKLYEKEGPNAPREAKEAMQLILHSMPEGFTQTPFTIITATKERVRKL
jgi:hypothetical protein